MVKNEIVLLDPYSEAMWGGQVQFGTFFSSQQILTSNSKGHSKPLCTRVGGSTRCSAHPRFAPKACEYKTCFLAEGPWPYAGPTCPQCPGALQKPSVWNLQRLLNFLLGIFYPLLPPPCLLSPCPPSVLSFPHTSCLLLVSTVANWCSSAKLMLDYIGHWNHW